MKFNYEYEDDDGEIEHCDTDELFDGFDSYAPDYSKGFVIDEKAINQILQKTDRILGKNEKITLIASKGTQGLACSDNVNLRIYMDYPNMKSLKTIDSLYKFLILSKALNFHEFEHLKLTDYTKASMQRFMSKKYGQGHSHLSLYDFFPFLNLLEDCRIENLASLEYPRMKYYFTFCVINILANEHKTLMETDSKSGIVQNYLVMYGRKFLFEDEEMRKTLKMIKKDFLDKYPEDKNLLIDGERIVDTFIKTSDMNQRFELAYELADMFYKKNMDIHNDESIGNYGKSDMEHMKANKGSKELNERLSKEIENIIDQLNQQLENQDCDDDSQSQDSEESQESDDDLSDKILNSNRVQNLKKQIEQVKENQSVTEGYKQRRVDELSKQMEDYIDETKKCDSLSKKLEKIFKNISEKIESNQNIKDELSHEMVKLEKSQKKEILKVNQEMTINEQLRSESHNLEKVLRILRGDLHFRLNKYQNKGKIDVSSVIKSRQNNTLKFFKNKQMNKVGKSKMGISLIIDSSGSIGDEDFPNEIKTAWCLSDSLEKLDNHVEVIEFSDDSRTLKPFDKKGDWKRTMNGSTYIVEPMEQSMNSLLKLKRDKNVHNLFTIIITDGVNDEGTSSFVRQVEKMKRAGIKVMWIYASSSDYSQNIVKINSQYVDWFFKIEDISELSQKMQEIILDIQKKINSNILRR